MPTFDNSAAYGEIQGASPGGAKYEQGGYLFKADGTYLSGTITVSAADTIDLESVDSPVVHLNGSGTVTSFGVPSRPGLVKYIIVDDADIIFSYGVTGIVLPDGGDITSDEDDKIIMVSDIVGGILCWQCMSYFPLDFFMPVNMRNHENY